MSEPNEAVLVDVTEPAEVVKSRIEEARRNGKPVFFTRNSRFVAVLRHIPEDESAEMTDTALSQMAREIAAGQSGPRGAGGN